MFKLFPILFVLFLSGCHDVGPDFHAKCAKAAEVFDSEETTLDVWGDGVHNSCQIEVKEK